MSYAKLMNVFRSGTRVFYTNHTEVDRTLLAVSYQIATGSNSIFARRLAQDEWNERGTVYRKMIEAINSQEFHDLAMKEISKEVAEDIIKTRKFKSGRGWAYIDVDGMRENSQMTIVNPLNSQGCQIFRKKKQMNAFLEDRIRNAASYIDDIVAFDNSFDDFYSMLDYDYYYDDEG